MKPVLTPVVLSQTAAAFGFRLPPLKPLREGQLDALARSLTVNQSLITAKVVAAPSPAAIYLYDLRGRWVDTVLLTSSLTPSDFAPILTAAAARSAEINRLIEES
ncbi:hypothetical protein IHN63_00265 [Deinococcus sp. 6YEL10]|uniref:hypothetical protein n=1 Tax=Deinococcus sp. 6YEL10 TaxID=2745870 RepID=UPI001E423C77|nr:hypothetical protein [Deinococcus sp. 6YEL10]MCD0159732.1 hypothetical protein [Deinococcus sp. 6YEL10]